MAKAGPKAKQIRRLNIKKKLPNLNFEVLP